MENQTFSINSNQNEVVRKGNFSIVDSKVFLTTCVYVWNSRTSQLKGLSNNQIVFDLNNNYDASLNYFDEIISSCLLYTSPSPRDATLSRMPSSA